MYVFSRVVATSIWFGQRKPSVECGEKNNRIFHSISFNADCLLRNINRYLAINSRLDLIFMVQNTIYILIIIFRAKCRDWHVFSVRKHTPQVFIFLSFVFLHFDKMDFSFFYYFPSLHCAFALNTIVHRINCVHLRAHTHTNTLIIP